jgi:predicted RNase H-like HicB family nuclease
MAVCLSYKEAVINAEKLIAEWIEIAIELERNVPNR